MKEADLNGRLTNGTEGRQGNGAVGHALQTTIPHMTRSLLHRCLRRHSISQPPTIEGDTPTRRTFKSYSIDYFHIDIAEVRTEQGTLRLLVAIERTSKFTFVELHQKVTIRIAADFLRHLIAAVSYRVHTVLTNNGIHFTDLKYPESAVQ